MRARVHVPAVLLPARGGHEVFRGGAGEFGARERCGGGQSGGEGGSARRDKRSDERRVPGEAGRAGLRVLDQDRAVQVRRGVQVQPPERIARVMDRRLRLNAHQRRRIGWLWLSVLKVSLGYEKMPPTDVADSSTRTARDPGLNALTVTFILLSPAYALFAVARTPCSCVSCVVPAITSTSPWESGTAAIGLFAPNRYTSKIRGDPCAFAEEKL
mmetsp:Transcript_981/g.3983  ORF Transcript_981/g.3983 Transcript_981/m.3983 type:complete len:214 (+) Transcript_981:2913-3554(+)